MRRPAALLAGSMLVLALSACNGDSEEPEAAPEPTETTPAGPPPQPEGADGVTWEIQNWEDHAEDEAVLVWKQTNEAIGASINEGELLSAARDGMTRDALQPYIDSYQYARDNDFVVRDVANVKIESSETTDDGARVVACVWTPSAVLYDSDGEPVGGEPDESWSREVVGLSDDDSALVIDSVEFDGTCEGGEPE